MILSIIFFTFLFNSNVFLSVSPICRTNHSNHSIGAAVGETVELECNVEASPASVTFDWTVNRLIINNNIQNSIHGLTSRLSYKLHTKDDFGTIECRAKNVIGLQRQACLFHIIAAGLHSHHIIEPFVFPFLLFLTFLLFTQNII